MNTSTFDIRNFIDKLEPTRQKNKYHCPVCQGNDFEIEPISGKYSCFHGCDRRDIREALKPWAEVIEEAKNNKLGEGKMNSITTAPKKAKPQLEPVVIPDGRLAIARLSEFPTDIPQPSKPQVLGKKTREKLEKDDCTQEEIAQATVVVYDYGNEKKAHRYQCPCAANEEKGYTKTFCVSRVDEEGTTEWNKGSYTWNAYRQNEAIASALAIEESRIPVILAHEGEKCVEAARAEKLAGISAQGTPSENDWVCILNEIKLRMGERSFIIAYCPDNDDPGMKKAETLAKAAIRSQVSLVLIDLKAIFTELCHKGDIADILGSGMSGDELAELVLQQIYEIKAEANNVEAEDDSFNFDDTLNPNVSFNQKALNFLYGDEPWISADGNLYRWDGNHYKYSPDSVERPKIASFCNSYVVKIKSEITYPYATPAKAEEVLKWVKMRFEKDPRSLNPPGINCSNGVVRVRWEKGKPVRFLEEHDPSKHYYTYEPLVKYDPEADSTDCDRLLKCLDEPQQQVLLRNLGSSIDLKEVRKRRGREVKVLLACGLGSNGKDALRQTVSTIFGHQGMTSVSLADFVHYDDGRKFALAPLLYSRVNWASENPQTARLDKIQSLKLFATGNNLHSERKGKDHIEYTPEAVGIFNLNDVPALQGTIQAIQDRIAPLEFRKTFKIDPDPNNPDELQADPRFAYDEDFVQTNVAPAFLNKMLDALEALIEEGIDYSCTTNAFKSMQKENNHLFQFCEDIKLGYLPDSETTAKELWAWLEKWYLDNGTLTIEGEGGKRLWVEQARPSDRNVKGINQVIPRILALFPKAKKSSVYDAISKRSISSLSGIGIITSSLLNQVNENTRTTNENTRTKPAPLPAPESLINQDLRTTRTTFPENKSDEEKTTEVGTLLDLPKKEEEFPKTGAGSAEPSNHNTFSQSDWYGTGAGVVESGAGSSKRNFAAWIKPGQVAKFLHECYTAFPLFGEILEVETKVINEEEVFWSATIKYWKTYKNRDSEVSDAKQFTYEIQRADWLLEPVSGKLRMPKITTKNKAAEFVSVAEPQEPQEQFTEEVLDSQPAETPKEEKREIQIPFGTPIVHNGGKNGPYHERFGAQGIVQESFGGDYFVRFEDGKILRCEVEEMDIQF